MRRSYEQLAQVKRFNYPASVMVLEQWSDERTFYLWHPTHWKDPAAMVQRVRDAGLAHDAVANSGGQA